MAGAIKCWNSAMIIISRVDQTKWPSYHVPRISTEHLQRPHERHSCCPLVSQRWQEWLGQLKITIRLWCLWAKARTRNLTTLPCCESSNKVYVHSLQMDQLLSLSELMISAMTEQIKGRYSSIIFISKTRPDELKSYLGPRVERNHHHHDATCTSQEFQEWQVESEVEIQLWLVKNKSTSHKLAVLPCAERFEWISVHAAQRQEFEIDINLTILGMTVPIDGRNSTYDDVHEQG